MHSELHSAINAARLAGHFQKEKFRKKIEIHEKGPANLVTEVDLRSEKIIIEVLKQDYPNIPVLTEESVFQTTKDPEVRWIIDPLDGTTNYAHGYPFFGVSIALEEKGFIVLGVVNLPIFNEIYYAELGKGAYLNDQKIAVSKTNRISESLVGSGFPYDAWSSDRDNNREWSGMVKKVTSMRCDGAAALDLCMVASGVLDGYWELDLEPWDMAAGSLIVSEAGGALSLVSGDKFNPYSRSILASNGIIHQFLIEELKSGENHQ